MVHASKISYFKSVQSQGNNQTSISPHLHSVSTRAKRKVTLVTGSQVKRTVRLSDSLLITSRNEERARCSGLRFSPGIIKIHLPTIQSVDCPALNRRGESKGYPRACATLFSLQNPFARSSRAFDLNRGRARPAPLCSVLQWRYRDD